MLYAIIGEDAPNSLSLRVAARTEHLARVGQLQAEGRLIIAGPFPAIDVPDTAAGCVGSLIVAEFDSLGEAQAWLAIDPYVAAGVYARTRVYPFKQALPA